MLGCNSEQRTDSCARHCAIAIRDSRRNDRVTARRCHVRRITIWKRTQEDARRGIAASRRRSCVTGLLHGNGMAESADRLLRQLDPPQRLVDESAGSSCRRLV